MHKAMSPLAVVTVVLAVIIVTNLLSFRQSTGYSITVRFIKVIRKPT